MNIPLSRLAVGAVLALALATGSMGSSAEAGSTRKPRVQTTVAKTTKVDKCAQKRNGFYCDLSTLYECVGGKIQKGKSECPDGCDAAAHRCVDTNSAVGAENSLQ